MGDDPAAPDAIEILNGIPVAEALGVDEVDVPAARSAPYTPGVRTRVDRGGHDVQVTRSEGSRRARSPPRRSRDRPAAHRRSRRRPWTLDATSRLPWRRTVAAYIGPHLDARHVGLPRDVGDTVLMTMPVTRGSCSWWPSPGRTRRPDKAAVALGVGEDVVTTPPAPTEASITAVASPRPSPFRSPSAGQRRRCVPT